MQDQGAVRLLLALLLLAGGLGRGAAALGAPLRLDHRGGGGLRAVQHELRPDGAAIKLTHATRASTLGPSDAYRAVCCC